MSCNTLSKEKSTQIVFKKKDEITDCISPKVPIVVEPPVIVKYVTSGFNGVQIAWTIKVLFREKLKVILSYWSVISDCSYSSHT